VSVKRDLQNAATLLREMGWCQGDYFADGRRDFWGAIFDATNIPPWRDVSPRVYDAGAAVAAHLGIDPLPSFIADWNDAPGRTAEEVIAAFEAAAEAAP
jgi:hypothetical protein